MNKDFTLEELVELRCDLTYAAQKVANLVIARLSAKHREKHTEHYSADELITAKKDHELAEFHLRGAADKMLPALQALAQEAGRV